MILFQYCLSFIKILSIALFFSCAQKMVITTELLKKNQNNRWDHQENSPSLSPTAMSGSGSAKDPVTVNNAADNLSTGGTKPTDPGAVTWPDDQSYWDKTKNSGYKINTLNKEAVKKFHQDIYGQENNQIDAQWIGNVASCNAGSLSALYKEAIRRRINWFRAMAGVPAEVSFSDEKNQQNQSSALIIAANNKLDHYPSSDSRCYTSAGASAAGSSNLALGSAGSGEVAVDTFIDDSTNIYTTHVVGHRIHLLNPELKDSAVGDIPGICSSILINPWPASAPTRDGFIAWPPKGYIAHPFIYKIWSFSPSEGSLNPETTVTMTVDGQPLDVTVFKPYNGTIGWEPKIVLSNYQQNFLNGTEKKYQVKVTSVTSKQGVKDFIYDVIVY